MTESLPLLLAVLAVGIALGAAAILWLKSRKTSTKAELLYALAFEAKQIAKLPGAAEAIELAQDQLKAEALAQANLLAAMQKAAGVPAQS
jgi:hypothetical protein